MTHALAVNPRSPAAHNHLGHLCFARGDLAGAEKHIAAAVREKDDYLGARDNLAVTLAAEGRTDEAIALMTETLAQRRRLPPPIRQPILTDLDRLATLLSARGRYAEAAAYLRELADLSPNDPTVRQRLAQALSRAATQPAATRPAPAAAPATAP
jgi:Flp pilus assembly protein TadD